MTATKSVTKFEFCSCVEEERTHAALFVWVAEMSKKSSYVIQVQRSRD